MSSARFSELIKNVFQPRNVRFAPVNIISEENLTIINYVCNRLISHTAVRITVQLTSRVWFTYTEA